MQEIVVTGKTVDEAVEQGCAGLGLSRDEVGYEVLEMPKRKLFGSSPAKVRVYLAESAFSVKDLLRSEAGAAGSSKPESRAETLPAAPMRPAETAPAVSPAIAIEKTVPPAAGAVPDSRGTDAPDDRDLREIPESELSGSSGAALRFLKDVAGKMGAVKLSFRAVEAEDGVKFLVDGEDSALLIGRRGEVMDALQYLCLLVRNRSDGEYCKISIDVANYRFKREKALQALARRTAEKVLKIRRSQTLEPMNPYERRIVHSTIQEVNGVRSESVGEEPNRRVVVLPEGDTVSFPRGGERRDNRGGGRGYQGAPGKRGNFRRDGNAPVREVRGVPDGPVPAAPRQEDSGGPKADAGENPAREKPREQPADNKNLYGKIEI